MSVTTIIESAERGVPTWALPRDQFVDSNLRKKNPQFFYTLARRSPVVVPSGIHVNIGNGARVANKPGIRGWSPVDLRGAQKLSHGFGRGWRVVVVQAFHTKAAIFLRRL